MNQWEGKQNSFSQYYRLCIILCIFFVYLLSLHGIRACDSNLKWQKLLLLQIHILTKIQTLPLMSRILHSLLYSSYQISRIWSLQNWTVPIILWKYQLLSIFESYSLLDHIDGSTQSPKRYLQDASGAFTSQESVQYK